MKCLVLVAAVCGVFLLAGCPPPAAPSLPAKEAPAPPQQNTVSLPREDFVGGWTTQDAEGYTFDFFLFSNGQFVSTSTKSASGARGERGFWRADEAGVLVFLDSGASQRLRPMEGGFQILHFHSGEPVSTQPHHVAVAKRLEGDMTAFVGVWKLNIEPDGTYLYMALQSTGRAFSSISGGTEGKWEVTKEGALVQWPDGWTDLIFPTAEGFQKRSWVGAVEQNTTPPDISPATRAGETHFDVLP